KKLREIDPVAGPGPRPHVGTEFSHRLIPSIRPAGRQQPSENAPAELPIVETMALGEALQLVEVELHARLVAPVEGELRAEVAHVSQRVRMVDLNGRAQPLVQMPRGLFRVTKIP